MGTSMCVCVWDGQLGFRPVRLEEFVLQGRCLGHQGAFWLVVFNVPSADRTSSKVDKDTLFLSSLSVPVLTDDIGPCLWHLVYNAKLWCANDKVCWDCVLTFYEVHMSWRFILKVHSVIFVYVVLANITAVFEPILTPSGVALAIHK